MTNKKLIKLFVIVTLTSFVSACGGSTPISMPVVGIDGGVIAKQEVINGIAVPPDPGAARDATIAGVDSDGNGIRDEIDRWIATKYGSKPGALEAIRMVAKVRQKLMTSNPTNRTDALAVAYESIDVGGCTWNKLDAEGVKSSELFNETMIRTFNTRERIDSRKSVLNMAGMILRDSEDTTISCPYK